LTMGTLMGAADPSPMPRRRSPGEPVAFLINLAFCLLASLSLGFGLWVLIEELDFEPPDFVLVVLVLAALVLGLRGLNRWYLRLWQSPGRWRVVALLTAQALVLAPGFAGLVAWKNQRKVTETPFAPYLADYFAMTPAADRSGPGHIRGHCVVVSDQGGAAAFETLLMEALPRPIRARSPAEVGSVVQLRWGQRTLSYPAGAWIHTCVITVLDADTRQVLARKEMEGTWREIRPKGGKPFWTGALEWGAVSNYLRELPRIR
jgi:hypothetical protein